MKQISPLARKKSLIIKELPTETLVYDLENDKAHCLNQTAAFVWRNCSGQKTVGDIARSLAEELKTPVDNTVVWLALDQLEKFKLLEKPVDRPAYLFGLSRRQMVQRLGLAAAVALPLITSIIAPVPAQAASPCSNPTGRPGGCPCTTNGQCTSGGCNGGICDP